MPRSAKKKGKNARASGREETRSKSPKNNRRQRSPPSGDESCTVSPNKTEIEQEAATNVDSKVNATAQEACQGACWCPEHRTSFDPRDTAIASGLPESVFECKYGDPESAGPKYRMLNRGLTFPSSPPPESLTPELEEASAKEETLKEESAPITPEKDLLYIHTPVDLTPFYAGHSNGSLYTILRRYYPKNRAELCKCCDVGEKQHLLVLVERHLSVCEGLQCRVELHQLIKSMNYEGVEKTFHDERLCQKLDSCRDYRRDWSIGVDPTRYFFEPELERLEEAELFDASDKSSEEEHEFLRAVELGGRDVRSLINGDWEDVIMYRAGSVISLNERKHSKQTLDQVDKTVQSLSRAVSDPIPVPTSDLNSNAVCPPPELVVDYESLSSSSELSTGAFQTQFRFSDLGSDSDGQRLSPDSKSLCDELSGINDGVAKLKVGGAIKEERQKSPAPVASDMPAAKETEFRSSSSDEASSDPAPVSSDEAACISASPDDFELEMQPLFTISPTNSPTSDLNDSWVEISGDMVSTQGCYTEEDLIADLASVQ